MMKKNNFLKFEIFSSIFIMVLGTLLHFTYEFSNNNRLVGVFSAVNESTWEHLKLVFFPTLLTILVGTLYFKNSIPNYLCSKIKGLCVSLAFIVIFFYTSTGVVGKNVDFLNIASFFVSITLGECLVYKNILLNKKCSSSFYLIILVVLIISFLIFTFYPIHIGIFKDPVSGMYGFLE